ncbi:hypothetical protein, partial [Actinobacillus pleuropneumoniae]
GSFEDESMLKINSGASRHMTGECGHLNTLSKGSSSHKDKLGDKNSDSFKGIRSTSIELESSGNIHLNNIRFEKEFAFYFLFRR